MKPEAFMYVVVADQVGSRGGTDRVPAALSALDGGPGGAMTLRFERTTGDELQGLTDDPSAVVSAVVRLTRLGGWRIGIGAGEVELPLPSSTREARGPAYVAAREAIEAAHSAPADLALVLAPGAATSGSTTGRSRARTTPEAAGADTRRIAYTDAALRSSVTRTVSAGGYREPSPDTTDAETALWLLRFVLAGRSREGWELVDLLDQGLSSAKAAAALGISPSAASQRLARAHRTEARRGALLATRLLGRLREPEPERSLVAEPERPLETEGKSLQRVEPEGPREAGGEAR